MHNFPYRVGADCWRLGGFNADAEHGVSGIED